MYRHAAVPAAALLCLAAAACGGSSTAAPEAASPSSSAAPSAAAAPGTATTEALDAVETTATTDWTEYHGGSAHRGYAASVPPAGALKEAWPAPVLDGQVHRPRARVLLLDRLEDHRRVGRQRARVVGDEQGAAVGRDVLDPLDLAAEPQVVEEVVDRPVQRTLDAL